MTASEGTTLLDISSEGATLTIPDDKGGSRTYDLRVLKIGDNAKAKAFLRSSRINAYLEETRKVLLSDAERSATMAEIVCRPIPLTAIWGDSEGEAYLLWLAIRHNDPPITWEWVLNEMPPFDRQVLNDVLFHICNVAKPTEESTDPLDAKTDT